MDRVRLFLSCIFFALCGVSSGAHAASYPNKTIEMVVAGSPGGGLDLVGRALDSALHETKLLKEAFTIKNMGGAGGNLAKTYTHQKKGDPHYVYVESNRIYVARIVGTTPLTYNDVTPLGRLMTEYLVWAVRADSPLKSAKDVLAKLEGALR